MAILKIVDYFKNVDASDFTWAAILLLIWNASEINSVIIAACIAPLQPLMSAIFGSGTLRRHSERTVGYIAQSTSFNHASTPPRSRREPDSWTRMDDIELRDEDLAMGAREADADSSKRMLANVGPVSITDSSLNTRVQAA